MAEIISKEQCYKLYNMGVFGNRPLTWDNKEDLYLSGYSKNICIRGINIPREEVKYNISIKSIPMLIKKYEEKGIVESRLRYNQSMPDDKLLIQGEIMRSNNHLNLTYTNIKKPMNLALKEKEEFADGLTARIILENTLWPASISDVNELFIKYPDSVIEFSTYEIGVGDKNNRNTIIWEVRNY